MSASNVLTRNKKKKADAAAQAGQLNEARDLFQAVCRADRSDIEAWIKLGEVQRQLGNYVEAESCGRQAVALKPRLALSHYLLGAALQCQSKIEDAIACHRQAIELQPDLTDSLYMLGNALMTKGELDEARTFLVKALELQPQLFAALSDLGAVLLMLNRLDEGATVLEKALNLRPDSQEALCNLALLKERQSNVEQAFALFDLALKHHPGAADVCARKADLLEKLGRLEEAEITVNEGLLQSPLHPSLNLTAARIDRRSRKYNEAIGRIETVINQPMPQDVNADVCLLLGQLYDQVGATEKVFPQLVQGKRLAASVADPDGKAHARFSSRVDSVKSWLGNMPLNTSAIRPSHADEAPIFMVGFPRSGTTLLEQILDSHPRLQTFEEKPMAAVVEQQFLKIIENPCNSLASLSDAQISQLQAAYFSEAANHAQRQPGTYMVDKLPLNLILVPLLWRIFPNAKFILVVRHPCDVVLSCFMQNFAHNDAMACFTDLKKISDVYKQLLNAWIHHTETLPLQWHRIRYEDLITDFDTEARKLLDFLGVGWDDCVRNHVEHAKSRGLIHTPSYHQVTQPMYQQAKYRWLRYEKEFEACMPLLQRFINHFDYTDIH